MQCSTMVQGFTGATEVDLPLPCTYDFEVAGSSYLHALRRRRDPAGCCCSAARSSPAGTTGFGVEQVPWDREARYRLPVAVWRDLMAALLPRTRAGCGCDHDTLAALAALPGRRAGLTTWDETVDGAAGRRGERPVTPP